LRLKKLIVASEILPKINNWESDVLPKEMTLKNPRLIAMKNFDRG